MFQVFQKKITEQVHKLTRDIEKHRIIEYPVLEGTYKDQRLQLLDNAKNHRPCAWLRQFQKWLSRLSFCKVCGENDENVR